MQSWECDCSRPLELKKIGRVGQRLHSDIDNVLLPIIFFDPRSLFLVLVPSGSSLCIDSNGEMRDEAGETRATCEGL